MMSKWGKSVSPENVWQEYPRPQFERENWENLNGLWEYAILKNNQRQPQKFQGKILVPFSFESALSGVGKKLLQEIKCGIKEIFVYLSIGVEKI